MPCGPRVDSEGAVECAASLSVGPWPLLPLGPLGFTFMYLWQGRIVSLGWLLM